LRRAGPLLALALAGCQERAPEASTGVVADAEPRAEFAVSAAPTAAAPEGPAAVPAAAPGEEGASRYTSLEGCRLLRADTEGGGFSEELCAGPAGYSLKRGEGDGRQNLVLVRPDGRENNPQLPSWSGGGFSTLGPRVEWRGSPPQALIVRYSVAEQPDRTDRPTSYLVVMRLRDGEPCMAGKVPPGPGQNAQARRLADGNGECLPFPDE
jgi:hypothetical protein